MMRTRMRMTIDAPPGGAAERVCEALRDMGYTVNVQAKVPGTQRLVVEMLAPHGEINSRRFVGKQRRA